MGQIDFDGSNSTVKADIIRGQTGTTVKLGGLLDTDGNYIQTEKGGDIASASPLVVDTDGDYFDVTGTTNFAAMTVAADRQFTLQFDGVLTMTHHATNLDLPGEANITTAAGDVATFQSTGSNTVQCINYTKADGTGVVAAAGGNKTVWLSAIANDSTQAEYTDLSNFPCFGLDDSVTDKVNGAWTVPDDFTAITSLKCIVNSNGAGDLLATFSGIAFNAGNVFTGSTDQIAETTYALTDTICTYIDVTAAVDGLTLDANECLGVEISRNGGGGGDTINTEMYVYGWILVYS